MNRNPKEKFARIDIRVNQKDKDKIKTICRKMQFNLLVNIWCKGHWNMNR